MTRKLTGDHCQCSACGEYFNSTHAFDKHRTGDYSARRCRTVAEMQARGMGLSSTGWWLSSKRPFVRRQSDPGAAIYPDPPSGSAQDEIAAGTREG